MDSLDVFRMAVSPGAAARIDVIGTMSV